MLQSTSGKTMQNDEITSAEEISISVQQAAEVMSCSEQTIRLLLLRKKLTKYLGENGTIHLKLSECLNYHPKKKRLPGLENNDISGHTLVPIEKVCESVKISDRQARNLIRDGKIAGWVSATGQVFIGLESLNAYYQGLRHDANDL